MNISKRPHMRHEMRGVSNEKRRQVQYAMDKRREEQGKKVIYLHEKPPPLHYWPRSETFEVMLSRFVEQHGKLPTACRVSFPTSWTVMGWKVSMNTGEENKCRDGLYLIELQVIRDLDVTEGFSLE